MLMFLCSRVSEHFTLSFLFAPRREITRATSPRSEWTQKRRFYHLQVRLITQKVAYLQLFKYLCE